MVVWVDPQRKPQISRVPQSSEFKFHSKPNSHLFFQNQTIQIHIQFKFLSNATHFYSRSQINWRGGEGGTTSSIYQATVEESLTLGPFT